MTDIATLAARIEAAFPLCDCEVCVDAYSALAELVGRAERMEEALRIIANLALNASAIAQDALAASPSGSAER